MSTKPKWWTGSIDPEAFIEANVRVPGYLYGFQTEQPYFLPLLHEEDFITAYRICAPLKAIVGKKAKAHTNGIIEVVNEDNTKQACGREAKMLKDMFGSGSGRPNVLQTSDQFFSQQNHYVELFGYCPFVVMRPTGFVDEIKGVWNIPPWLFDLEYTRRWLYEFQINGVYKKFYMQWEGKRIEIDPRDLHFVFDDGIGSETDSELIIPDSRLIGLDYVVSNIVAAYKSRNTLITKRGAIGILSNEGTDASGHTPLAVDPKIRESLQNDFKKYGIVGQPFQIIVTDARLKWQQMGFATKDLLLFEEIEDDIFRLCDAYGVPHNLMAVQKGTTFNNKNQARIDLYHDTIIPESAGRMQQFTKGVASKGSGLKLIRNFDNVPALQPEKLAKAETRKALNEALQIEYNAGLITKNMWLEALGEDTIADPEFDEYKKPEQEDDTRKDKDPKAKE